MMLRALVVLTLTMALAQEPETCDGAGGSECEAGDVLLQAKSDRKSVPAPEAGGKSSQKFERFVDALLSAGVAPGKFNQTLKSVLEIRDSAKLNEDDVASWLAQEGFTSDQTRITKEYLNALGDAGIETLKKHAGSQAGILVGVRAGETCAGYGDCGFGEFCKLDHTVVAPGCAFQTCCPYQDRSASCGVDYECWPADRPCIHGQCCFPGHATVTREDGLTVLIADLRLGDRIVATDEDGRRVIDEVAFSSLADGSAKRRAYLQVTTSEGSVLDITGGHHVPVGTTCCTDLKVARDLRVGDKMWTLDSSGHHARAQIVSSIRQIVADGLHSPLLVGGGFPVVSNFVTSFGDLQQVRSAAKVYPFVQRVAVSLGVSTGAAKLDNLYECAKAKFAHVWAGNGPSSAPACGESVFIRSRQIEVTV